MTSPASTMSTLRTGALPMVLVVGCSPTFRARCREAAEAIPAILQECDFDAAALAVDVWGPMAVVLTDDVLGFSPPGFRAMLKALRAKLLKLPSEKVDVGELEVLMRLAIYEAQDLSA